MDDGSWGRVGGKDVGKARDQGVHLPLEVRDIGLFSGKLGFEVLHLVVTAAVVLLEAGRLGGHVRNFLRKPRHAGTGTGSAYYGIP